MHLTSKKYNFIEYSQESVSTCVPRSSGGRRLAAGIGGLLTHFLLSLTLAWPRLDTAALETAESEPGVCLTHKLVLLICIQQPINIWRTQTLERTLKPRDTINANS